MAAYVPIFRRRERLPRVYKKRIIPIDELRDSEIVERYRLTREAIIYVHNLIKYDISAFTERNHALDSMTKVFAIFLFKTLCIYISKV